MFCGFSDDKLSSLVVAEIYKCAEDQVVDPAAVLDKCKRMLVDVAPADAMIRAELSMLAQQPDGRQEVNDLTERYFETSYHSSLISCLEHFWNHLVVPTSSNRSSAAPSITRQPSTAFSATVHRLVIMTFTNIIQDLNLPEGYSSKVLNLGNFYQERSLRDEIQRFWSDEDDHSILIMQCDAIRHSMHLLLCREIMREYEEAHKKRGGRPKEQAIIMHMR